MFLLFCGGHSPRPVFSHLMAREIPFVSWYPNLKEAGAYGAGGAIIGPVSEKSLETASAENRINGIIDIMSESYVKDSLLVMSFCRRNKISYVKCLPMAYNKNIGDFKICRSYDALAEEINHTLGNILFYAKAGSVRAFVKRLPDPSALYVPVLRGAGFDVETALLFGIPLRNVVELDGIDDTETVKNAIQKIDAQLVICDGSFHVGGIAEACAQIGVPLRLTHSYGIEFLNTAITVEELLEFLNDVEGEKENGTDENI